MFNLGFFTGDKVKYGNGREAYWDNIKGFLIFLVVLGHFLYDYQNTEVIGIVVRAIYVFHMPAFVFLTGYLSKSEKSRSVQALLKLFVAYLVFNTLTMIILGGEYKFVFPYYSYWYILAVIVWRIVVERLASVWFLWFSICIAIIAGMYTGIDNTFAIARIIAFLPFFMAGYIYDHKKVLEVVKNKLRVIRVLGVGCAIWLAVVIPAFVSGFKPTISDLTMATYFNSGGIILRVIIFSLSALAILVLMAVSPRNYVPVLTRWGRNSFVVYLLHRFPTIVFSRQFPNLEVESIMLFSVIGTVIVLGFMGTDTISGLVNRYLDELVNIILRGGKGVNDSEEARERTHLIIVKGSVFCIIGIMVIHQVTLFLNQNIVVSSLVQNRINPVIHPKLSEVDRAKFDSAVRLSFVGDLILLEDDVKKAYTGDGYDFNSVFEYASKYISEADLAVGVFEGPCAGESVGYSSSNFGDGIPLFLNFPDSYAGAVKDAGFDLVTTANNHVFDKGEVGAFRTLDVLDSVGLDYIGSYRSQEDKESVFICEVGGIKFAFLAYTFGANLRTYIESYFTTTFLAEPNTDEFIEAKAVVLEDFERVKLAAPDIIIVMPHMGEQFSHTPNYYQEAWYEVFIEAGADIVVASHSHAVQPIEFRGDVLIVNCPGNFVNSYTGYNGDASALVEVYIDSEEKVLGVSIVPLYAQILLDEPPRALPIYDIMIDPVLRKQISVLEFERIKEVHGVITEVMLGVKLPLDMIAPRYYKTRDGFMQEGVAAISGEDFKNSEVLDLLSKVGSVCFIGDSITVGSRNGGTGWYRPLVESFDLKVFEKAWDGGTVKTLLDNSESIVSLGADLYVIAIGTNDVRYRDPEVCAMTTSEYIEGLGILVDDILDVNPNSTFVFIAPWLALENDPFNEAGEDRDKLLVEYGEVLSEFCSERGYLYIDPNPYIRDRLRLEPTSKYLIDYIHPGKLHGVKLYSEAVLFMSILD